MTRLSHFCWVQCTTKKMCLPAFRLPHHQPQPEFQFPVPPIQNSMINLTKKKTTSWEKWIKKQQNPTYIWSYLRLPLLTFHFFSCRVKHLLVLPECNCCLWRYNLNPSPPPAQPKAEFRYCSSHYKSTETKPLPGSQKAGERLNCI